MGAWRLSIEGWKNLLEISSQTPTNHSMLCLWKASLETSSPCNHQTPIYLAKLLPNRHQLFPIQPLFTSSVRQCPRQPKDFLQSNRSDRPSMNPTPNPAPNQQKFRPSVRSANAWSENNSPPLIRPAPRHTDNRKNQQMKMSPNVRECVRHHWHGKSSNFHISMHIRPRPTMQPEICQQRNTCPGPRNMDMHGNPCLGPNHKSKHSKCPWKIFSHFESTSRSKSPLWGSRTHRTQHGLQWFCHDRVAISSPRQSPMQAHSPGPVHFARDSSTTYGRKTIENRCAPFSGAAITPSAPLSILKSNARMATFRDEAHTHFPSHRNSPFI